jgi:hypothetical protein
VSIRVVSAQTELPAAAARAVLQVDVKAPLRRRLTRARTLSWPNTCSSGVATLGLTCTAPLHCTRAMGRLLKELP